ncbi:MAG: hypothetical protein AAB011_09480 [Candidatus Eisenbacteria bacterium]
MTPSNHHSSLRTPRARAWTVAGALALAAFTPVRGAADTIELTWTAPGDDGAIGQAASYELRFAASPIASGDTTGWWNGAQTAGVLPPPLIAGSRERFTVIGLTTGGVYHFVLRSTDDAGNRSAYSNVSVRQAGTAGGALATPSDFTAQVVTGGVRLAWSEPATGAGEGYHLYRRDSTSPDSLLATLPVVQTAFTDTTARGGSSYEYRVATHQNGLESPPAVAMASVPSDRLTTTTSAVRGYPNPASDRVSIRFRGGTADGAPGRVRVVIYDLTGHRITTLFDGILPSGEQALDWACRSDAGKPVAPGIYNVIVDAPSGRSVTQLAIIP